METGDIQNLIHKARQKRHGRRDRKIMHANREWFIIVICFFVLLLGSVAFGAWYYQWYSSLPDRVVATEESALPHYNTDLVNSVISVYTARSEKFLEKLSQGSDMEPGPAEESLPEGVPDELNDVSAGEEVVLDSTRGESDGDIEFVNEED